jgi:hypothetical protein
MPIYSLALIALFFLLNHRNWFPKLSTILTLLVSNNGAIQTFGLSFGGENGVTVEFSLPLRHLMPSP